MPSRIESGLLCIATIVQCTQIWNVLYWYRDESFFVGSLAPFMRHCVPVSTHQDECSFSDFFQLLWPTVTAFSVCAKFYDVVCFAIKVRDVCSVQFWPRVQNYNQFITTKWNILSLFKIKKGELSKHAKK